MKNAQRLRIAAIQFVAIVCGIITVSASIVHADCTVAGTVSITPATRAAATMAGIPSSVSCWNPADASAGLAAGDAKLWLQQHATNAASISCLNPQFAEKLEKFMQADPLGIPTVTSAYRTVTQQDKLIAEGRNVTRVSTACGSYHPWGLAADFNNNTKAQTTWMRANANQFGLTTIGTWDPNHFQDNAGKYGQCGMCNPSGNGNGTAAGTSNTPFDSSLRQLLGLQQPMNVSACLVQLTPPIIAQPGTVYQSQCLSNANGLPMTGQLPPQQPMTMGGSYAPSPLSQPVQQPTVAPSAVGTTATPPPVGTQNTTPYTPGTCSPQTWCSPQDGNIYYRASTCVDQIYQQCPYGCSGVVCNASSTPSSSSANPLSSLLSSNGSQGGSNGASSPSANDLINLLANPTSTLPLTAPTTSPTTTVVLNGAVQARNTVANILPYGAPSPANTSGYAGAVPGQVQSLSPQTFTSGNLANSPVQYPQNAPATFGALDEMKSILNNMLAYLSTNFQPFGGLVQQQQYSE